MRIKVMILLAFIMCGMFAYSGNILETYPANLEGITKIKIIE